MRSGAELPADMSNHHLWFGAVPPDACADPDLGPGGGDQAPGRWLADTYAAFERTLLHAAPAYPCYFGVQGQQRGHNAFTLVDRRFPERYGAPALARALLAYRDRAWTGPRRQSLIVFVGPPDPDADLATHHARFWSLLSELSGLDPAPWPATVPTDRSDPSWQWCFGGEPWFTFACAPAYRARRSRDLGPCLTLVLQVRRVFEGIGGSTVAGQAAKQRIRAGLTAYDQVPPHPYLGDPNLSSVHKWRQYTLPDDQSVAPDATCPLA